MHDQAAQKPNAAAAEGGTPAAATQEPAGKKAPEPRPTHFLSLAIRNPAALAAIAHLQDEIRAETPGLAPSLISEPKLHVSLAVMRCADDATVVKAKQALDSCRDVLQGLNASAVRMQLRGLGTFNDRVLWVGIESGDLLKNMASVVHEGLKAHGVVQDDSYVFEAHITVCKTSACVALPSICMCACIRIRVLV
jgi:2'-5' RNA ligase